MSHSLQCMPFHSLLPPANAALASAQLQELLANLPADMCGGRELGSAQFQADLARLGGKQLPEADHAPHRSLEALRLEDPAAMSGCWNPGCAARVGRVLEAPWRLRAPVFLSYTNLFEPDLMSSSYLGSNPVSSYTARIKHGAQPWIALYTWVNLPM